jgi:diadenosine tetraphosphate (Ap4A) HIT family hydrolase
MTNPPCLLCDAVGGVLVFQAKKFRVIRADETGFPAFYRVVWIEHVAEFSDLSDTDQVLCMQAVAVVEKALREVLQPTKINLAALGNVVPHLHWHVIARFDWDSHFPAPVWAQALRAPEPEKLASLLRSRGALEQLLVQRLAAALPGSA